MSASVLAVATAEGNRLSAPLALPSGKGTQYIHSIPGQRIVLSDAHHPGQPARMAMKRHGKNLLLTVPGEDEPRLVIYDFYENNARLQGIGEDGMPHDWVSADNGDITSDMDDGESAFLMLSGDAAADSTPLFVPEHNSGAWMAMAAFAGLLGLGGIARAMQNQHSGPGESSPPPPQIAMASDVTGIYTGALAHGGVTDDARPELTGSGSVPGELITVYADGVAIGSTLVAGDGTWTFRPDAALAHGLHTFTTTATAASGLVSEYSPGFDLDVDLLAPARPQVISADDATGTLTGALASGSVTDDAQPLFSGQAEPGSLIVFMLDGAAAGSATVAADGSWQWRPNAALPDGPHSFTARATDPAGNTGLPSIPFTFTVDTVIAQPLLESVTDAVNGGVEGTISNDGTGLTNDARPVLSGRAEAGSLVTIYDGGSAIGSVRADAETGAWRWQSSEDLAEGVHTLTVQATDPAGNVSVISDSFTITVDTLIDQPVITAVTDAVTGGTVGAVASDGTGLTNDARPLLDGTAEKGSLVTIYDGAIAIGSVYADVSTGAWRWQNSDDFAEGPHTLTVQATDPAGNTSVISDAFIITVDTVVAQPVLASVTDAVSGGALGDLTNDGTGLTNDPRPLLSGTAEKGSLVTVFDGTNTIGSVYADATTGAWSWQFTGADKFEEGPHTLAVQAIDPAGNTSVLSDAFTIIVDTLTAQPMIAVVTDAVTGGALGAIANDGTGLTNDARPVLSGRAEKGSLVTIFNGTTAVGSVYADATTGAWSWQFTGTDKFEEGPHTLTVQAVDPAGNISALSDSFIITVDTLITQPELATVTDAVSGGALGVIANDGIGLTNDARPALSGTAEKGSLVTIYDGTTPVGSVYADATTGAWRWQYIGTDKFEEGPHTLRVQAVDTAGNTSVLSDAFTINVDTVKPLNAGQNVSSVDPTKLWNGTVTDDNRPRISGMGEAGCTVTIYLNGVPVGTQMIGSNNQWHWQPDSVLDDGDYRFTTIITDPAGNASDQSVATDITVDTSPPSGMAKITAITHDSGYLNNVGDFYTDVGTTGRLISGPLDGIVNANERIQISVNGGVSWHDALRDPSGGWYWFDGESHANSWSIQTRVIDNLGRTGPAETQQVNVDTTRPEAPFELTYSGQDVTVYFSGNQTEKGGQVSLNIGGNYYLFTVTDADSDRGYMVITLPTSIEPNDNMLAAVVNKAGKLSEYRNIPESKEIDFSTYSGGYNFPAGTIVDGVTFNSTGHFHNRDSYTSGTSKGWLLHFWGGSSSLDLNRNELGTKDISFNTRMFSNTGNINFSFYDRDNNHLGSRTVTNANTSVNNLVEYHSDIPIYRVSFTYSGDVSIWDFNIMRSYTHTPDQDYAVTDESQYLIGSELNDSFTVTDVHHLDTVIQLGGGSGIDTLALTGANQVLDFTRLASTISSIEIIDITGTGDNTLMLSLGDILANGQVDLFRENGNLQLMVKGNAGDTVNLSDILPNGADAGDWNSGGNVNVGGTEYKIFQHSTLDAELLVQQNVTVNLDNH